MLSTALVKPESGIAANAPPRTPQLYSSTGNYIGRIIMYSATGLPQLITPAPESSFYSRRAYSDHFR